MGDQFVNEDIVVGLQEALMDVGIQQEQYIEGACDIRSYLLDSMAFISLIVGLENRFGVQFPDEILSYGTSITYELLRNTLESLKIDQYPTDLVIQH